LSRDDLAMLIAKLAMRSARAATTRP
jgi:hypothetical protein